MKITDFKVGDNVKVVGAGGYIEGKTGIIQNIYSQSVALNVEGSVWTFFENGSFRSLSMLHKITPLKPSSPYKFKKGDRVCRIRMSEYNNNVPVNSTGVVIEEESRIPFVRWDNKSLNKKHNDALSMKQDDMELEGSYFKAEYLAEVAPFLTASSASCIDEAAQLTPEKLDEVVRLLVNQSFERRENLTSRGYSLIKKTKMSLSKFAKKLFAPEVVTLIDAGFIDECGSGLTTAGTKALIEILYEEKRTELVKKAEEVLTERKAEEAKN